MANPATEAAPGVLRGHLAWVHHTPVPTFQTKKGYTQRSSLPTVPPLYGGKAPLRTGSAPGLCSGHLVELDCAPLAPATPLRTPLLGMAMLLGGMTGL